MYIYVAGEHTMPPIQFVLWDTDVSCCVLFFWCASLTNANDEELEERDEVPDPRGLVNQQLQENNIAE